MKQKLTINDLAIGNLKTRKKQYAIMIMGIILAMVFSSSILFFGSSYSTSSKEMSRREYGSANSIHLDATEEMFTEAKQKGVVSDYGFAHIVGYGYTDDVDNGTAIAWLDDEAEKLSYINIIEGTMPQGENDIVLESATASRLGLDVKIGDKITLDVFNQNGNDYIGEAESREYTLVGIAQNKCSNIIRYEQADDVNFKTVPSAFVLKGTQTAPGGKEKLFCYYESPLIKTDDKYGGRSDAFSVYCEKNKPIDENNPAPESLQWWQHRYLGHPGSTYSFLNLAASSYVNYIIVLASVLLLAACIGIINAFSSNLQERKKQIGMLKTVGATKRQIINIFGREAFILTLICTPVSVLISYFIVKFTATFLGDNFVFVPAFTTLVLSAVFGMICVMAAALIPLVSASRISPVQSIRNIDFTRKHKTKKIKTVKEFNPSSLIASRNIKFFKGKQAVVSFFLVAVIIFSFYGFSFMSYTFNNEDAYAVSGADYDLFSNEMEYNYNYINRSDSNKKYNENQRKEILRNPNVDEVVGSSVCKALVKIDNIDDYFKAIECYAWHMFELPDDYNNPENPLISRVNKDNFEQLVKLDYSDYYKKVLNAYQLEGNYYYFDIVSTQNNKLSLMKDFVLDGKIDIDKINSGEEVVLVAPEKLIYGKEKTPRSSISETLMQDDEINQKYNKNVEPLIEGELPYKAGDEIEVAMLFGGEPEDDTDFSMPANRTKIVKRVKIGAIVSDNGRVSEYCASGDAYLRLVTTNTGIKGFGGNDGYKDLRIYLNKNHSENVEQEMQEVITPITESVMGSYHSNYEWSQQSREQSRAMFVFMIAIIIITLCFTASIINNSLTARIRQSKREMGTLRAVGASERDLVLSYIRQLASMLGWGSAIGFGLSLISYGLLCIIHIKEHGNLSHLELSFNILPTIIACLILFAICSLNLWSKIKAEMKNSIIENIREL